MKFLNVYYLYPRLHCFHAFCTLHPHPNQPQDPTPDGHRAPVRELLSPYVHSKDTQTPSTSLCDDCLLEDLVLPVPGSPALLIPSSGSLSGSTSDSHSSQSDELLDSPTLPIIPGLIENSPPSSRCDSVEGKEKGNGRLQ